MALSRAGCRLCPLGLLSPLLLLLLLLLGQPAEGWGVFHRPLAASRLAQLMWRKQEAMLYQEATNALQMAVDHLSEKHNTTFSRAPGVPTHIMIENMFGRIYHVHTVLVEAKCLEGRAASDPKGCEIPPGALKLECKLEVAILFGTEEPYIKDDGCQDFKQPFPDHLPNPDEGGEGSEEEEEATPYI